MAKNLMTFDDKTLGEIFSNCIYLLLENTEVDVDGKVSIMDDDLIAFEAHFGAGVDFNQGDAKPDELVEDALKLMEKRYKLHVPFHPNLSYFEYDEDAEHWILYYPVSEDNLINDFNYPWG